MGTLQETSIERTNNKCWYKDVCQLDNDCKMCRRYNEMSYLMENSYLPKNKQKIIKLAVPECDEDAYKKLAEIKHDIYDFVYEGRNLYIGSKSTGNGKTSWSVKLMHSYFAEIWDGNGYEPRAVFVHVPTFLLDCKNFSNKSADMVKLEKLIKTVDLVVWDDVGSTGVSAYDIATLYAYIDYRNLSELANIYTANYETKDDLAKAVGNRLASRIWGEKQGEVVIFKGGDIR